MKFRYGTRGSALALAQSGWVAEQLKRLHPSHEFEQVVIQTSGDRFAKERGVLGPPIQDEKPVNVKAMFVKEIEEELLSGSIHFGVHSSKDLPAQLPAGLAIGAYPVREDPRDVFIPGPGTSKWNNLKANAVVATSSLRRQYQLRILKPDMKFVSMYGNIDTRLRKLSEGGAAGIVLAQAGLKRLGKNAIPHEVLPSEIVVPAPGQGALALECRSDVKEVLQMLAAFDDPETRMAVECERAVMQAMGGGCRTPLGAYAHQKGNHMELTVFWCDENGLNPIRRHARDLASPEAAKKLVDKIVKELRSK